MLEKNKDTEKIQKAAIYLLESIQYFHEKGQLTKMKNDFDRLIILCNEFKFPKREELIESSKKYLEILKDLEQVQVRKSSRFNY